MLVVAVICYGEDLIIVLDVQFKLVMQVMTYGRECLVQILLVVREEYDVVCILRSIERILPAYLCVQTLIHPVHEIGKHQVGEILRQVVAYRKSGSRVYNLVKQPKQILVLDFHLSESGCWCHAECLGRQDCHHHVPYSRYSLFCLSLVTVFLCPLPVGFRCQGSGRSFVASPIRG